MARGYMGVRRGAPIALTIGCAFVSRHLAGIREYAHAKEHARDMALEAGREVSGLELAAVVDAADDLDRGRVLDRDGPLGRGVARGGSCRSSCDVPRPHAGPSLGPVPCSQGSVLSLIDTIARVAGSG